MKITISGQDYTVALDAVRPLSIERKLNEPSVCQLWLSLPFNGSLAWPVRNAPISVTGDDGTNYFTGYIAVTPLPEYAGLGLTGPQYRIAIQALSDEILLDQMLMPPGTSVANESVSTLMNSLVTRSGSTALRTTGLSLSTYATNYVPEPGTQFSKSVGHIANQTRASYRALNGVLSVANVGTTVHPLNETDGSLTLGNLTFNASVQRALANDITVCGQHEPVAYVTEYFLGDGTTTQFYLSDDPFSLSTFKTNIIREQFNEGQLNTRVWTYNGGPGYIQLGDSGLMMNGGNGIDGQTTLSWIDPVEMIGTQILEAIGVSLSPGSTGVVAGLYSGVLQQSNCVAGFLVLSASGTGAITLQPLINGLPAGQAYSVNPANQYTLRIRSHCPEMARSQAIYRSAGDAGLIATGGNLNISGGKYLFTIQQYVNGVGGMPVILYDGAVANMPGNVTVVPASSLNLVGSIRALHLVNHGSEWIVSTPPSGSAFTRQVGTSAEASECLIVRPNKLVFFAGYVPQVGEVIAATYRTIGRSVGRAINAASQLSLSQSGLPSVSAWIGSVTNPPPRSSADCRNAASALEQAAASVSALWSGTYKTTRFSFATDVWPGDELQLTAPSLTLNVQVVVRSVKVIYSASYPDLVEYKIEFANDWATDLAIKASSTVPVDTWLPAVISPTVLPNLSNLTVTTLNGTGLQCSANVTLPVGGGIEVRRRDFAFQAGQDADLVARFTTPNFTLSRQNVNDRFYFRIYDGSTPPNYSEFSAALFINLPLSS